LQRGSHPQRTQVRHPGMSENAAQVIIKYFERTPGKLRR
jgi:hypothetical protein